MNKFASHQVWALLTALTVLVSSTAVLAHGHPHLESGDESHCLVCMAAHIVTHVIWFPPIIFQFTPVQTALRLDADPLFTSSPELAFTQDRAPPLSE